MNSLKLKMNDLGADSVKNVIDDKIHDILYFFQNTFGLFMNWLDDVFPPGTRMETLKNWTLLAAPYAILILVLLLCVPCLYRLVMGIFSCFFNILKGIWGYLCGILCCCCRGGRRMMKAPGRNVRISRMPFEAKPADYFRGLRANQPLSGYYLA